MFLLVGFKSIFAFLKTRPRTGASFRNSLPITHVGCKEHRVRPDKEAGFSLKMFHAALLHPRLSVSSSVKVVQQQGGGGASLVVLGIQTSS